jgi:methylglutaconyl-CoA hydratase
MDKTIQGYVNSDIRNSVATIEFFHPSHNSLPSNLLKKLSETIMECGQNDEVILILLKSAGERTFCAGASFDELVSIENADKGKVFFLGFANVINAIRTCGKLVIGRVQGKAVGGGVGLASACDYCIASKWASVKLSELAVGIGPFVIGPAVERKVGLSAFSQMAVNATEWMTATWAKEKGLFNEVFDTVEQLDEYIQHFMDITVKMNPEALSGLKKVFWEGTEHWDDLLDTRAQMSGELVLSKHSKETIGSFLKK